MPLNRLSRETSPYLLQHQDNPVDWWAWGPEALAEARRTGKPILLSVGYAACHWCHVMAHESFEDAATAEVMNELFVNIKVDREERPDIDAIYMGALHKLGQQGGWPLTMFLDTDARPFWGGTYFPKEARWGRAAFVDVLKMVHTVHRDEPAKVAHNADVILAAVGARAAPSPSARFGRDFVAEMIDRLAQACDLTHGGLEGAPKFPQWSVFWLLWRGAIGQENARARQAVLTTLENICQGGIYDHLAGGFARYSVDERWLVPHFEKMLYDNALLIDLLTEAWRETGNPLFKVRIAETVGWLEREMIADGGAFAASLDADSEGEEGKFYVWTAAEIADVLGAQDAAQFGRVYDVTTGGNWEGHTILNRLSRLMLGSDNEEQALAAMRARLLERRSGRVRPGWDDKVLADWNGLMIAALARASSVMQRPEWLELARRAFDCIVARMTAGDRLAHASRNGSTSAAGISSDYANMIRAALRLHEATQDDRYLVLARTWTDTLDRHFWDGEAGGYATSADDTSDVVVRLVTAHDDAVPNANATMISNLVQLATITGEGRFADRAAEIVRAFSGDVARSPAGHCGMVAALLDLEGVASIVIGGATGDTSGARARELTAALHAMSVPGALEYVMSMAPGASGGTSTAPLLAGKTGAERTAAYVCVGEICSAPIEDRDVLAGELRGIRTSGRAGPQR